eukprot:1157251-Pelagomonas_calceolata.AAC.4
MKLMEAAAEKRRRDGQQVQRQGSKHARICKQPSSTIQAASKSDFTWGSLPEIVAVCLGRRGRREVQSVLHEGTNAKSEEVQPALHSHEHA